MTDILPGHLHPAIASHHIRHSVRSGIMIHAATAHRALNGIMIRSAIASFIAAKRLAHEIAS
jgi:hypothetical protein